METPISTPQQEMMARFMDTFDMKALMEESMALGVALGQDNFGPLDDDIMAGFAEMQAELVNVVASMIRQAAVETADILTEDDLHRMIDHFSDEAFVGRLRAWTMSMMQRYLELSVEAVSSMSALGFEDSMSFFDDEEGMEEDGLHCVVTYDRDGILFSVSEAMSHQECREDAESWRAVMKSEEKVEIVPVSKARWLKNQMAQA